MYLFVLGNSKETYLFKDITWRWNRHRFREQMYGHEAGKVGGINWETVTFTYYYVQNR